MYTLHPLCDFKYIHVVQLLRPQAPPGFHFSIRREHQSNRVHQPCRRAGSTLVVEVRFEKQQRSLLATPDSTGVDTYEFSGSIC
eukprot:SAG22_NODE_7013_length_785_cov_1.402332_1_plen_83_part_10